MSVVANGLLDAWRTTLEHVDAEQLVVKNIQRIPKTFTGASRRWLLSVGKAAIAMHRGARCMLGPMERELVVAPRTSELHEDWDFVTFADHPEPSMASIAAGRSLRAFADDAAAEPDVAVYALVSGGASALCEIPARGLSLEVLRRLNRQDVIAGVSIEVLNRRRVERSAIKGGKLAKRFGEALRGASVLVDVPSGRPEVVGSGLFARDGLSVEILGTPQTLSQVFAGELQRRGWSPHIQPPVDVGLDALLKDVAWWCSTASVGDVWVAAGEVALTIPLRAVNHNGGRARHAGLAMAMNLRADQGHNAGRWLVFTAASDGCDGTGGAGALIVSTDLDGGLMADAQRALRDYRSGEFCDRHRMMLDAHSSRTNLCDVYAVARIG